MVNLLTNVSGQEVSNVKQKEEPAHQGQLVERVQRAVSNMLSEPRLMGLAM